MDLTKNNLHSDPGTSFVDYLRIAQPELLPHVTAGATSSSLLDALPHATTVVAMRYADGVVMAGDRRATAGMSIAHRKMDKVLAADLTGNCDFRYSRYRYGNGQTLPSTT